MEVTVLGSCANQTDNREGVSLLIDYVGKESGSIIIDTGPGVIASLLRCGRRACEITTVILTHTHGDHILGLPYLIWHRFYETIGTQDTPLPISIYGLANAIGLSKSMLHGCYGEAKWTFPIEFNVILPGDIIAHPELSIITSLADHPTPTIGLAISQGNKKIAYSSDTLPTVAFSEISANSNILFHEGMWTEDFRTIADRAKHSTAADAAKVANDINAAQLVLLHTFPKLIGKERTLLREAGGIYQGNISVPNTGTIYRV